jgi:hypothetical protein
MECFFFKFFSNKDLEFRLVEFNPKKVIECSRKEHQSLLIAFRTSIKSTDTWMRRHGDVISGWKEKCIKAAILKLLKKGRQVSKLSISLIKLPKSYFVTKVARFFSGRKIYINNCRDCLQKKVWVPLNKGTARSVDRRSAMGRLHPQAEIAMN